MVHGFWPILAQLNRPNLLNFVRLQSQAQIIYCHQQPPLSSHRPPPLTATFRPNFNDFSSELKKKKKKKNNKKKRENPAFGFLVVYFVMICDSIHWQNLAQYG